MGKSTGFAKTQLGKIRVPTYYLKPKSYYLKPKSVPRVKDYQDTLETLYSRTASYYIRRIK